MPAQRQGGGSGKYIDPDALKKTRAAEKADDKARQKIVNQNRAKKKPDVPAVVDNIKPKTDSKPKPKAVTVSTSSVVPRQSSISDGVNTKDLYSKAVLKIMLSLIRSSKDLLTRYNFSGIDKITDFYLDADNAARQTAIITQIARPKTILSSEQVSNQDKFSKDINAINNKIGDLVEDSIKSNFYGSTVGDTFYPLSPKILNGNAYYDLKFTIESITPIGFKYSLYEIG